METFPVTGSDGRKIGAYRFSDPTKARFTRLSGRTAFAKSLRAELIALHGSRCAIYLEEFDPKELQIDHRIPFEVAGDNKVDKNDPSQYMWQGEEITIYERLQKRTMELQQDIPEFIKEIVAKHV